MDTKWQDRVALKEDATQFIMKPNEPQAVGAGLWEDNAKKSFKTKQLTKKRKFDEPLKAKKPYKSVDGKIVPNNTIQMVIEDTAIPLNATQEIAKEKEIIEIADEDDMDIIEVLENQLCTECERSIIHCQCADSMDDKIDSACFDDDDYNSNLISSSSEDFSDDDTY